MKANDRAFPILENGTATVNTELGLSVRDYIAIKVMQAQIGYYGVSDGFEPLAKQSYQIADAMIAHSQSEESK